MYLSNIHTSVLYIYPYYHTLSKVSILLCIYPISILVCCTSIHTIILYPKYPYYYVSILCIPISILVCCTSIHTIILYPKYPYYYVSIQYPYYCTSIHTIILYPKYPYYLYYCTSIHTIVYLLQIYPYYHVSIHTIVHLSILSCIYPYYCIFISFNRQTDTHTHTPFSTFLFEPSSSCRTLFQIYSTPGYVHPPLKVKCIIFPCSCTCIAQKRKS